MLTKSEVCTEISSLAESYLSLEKWGFKKGTYLFNESDTQVPLVVYHSQAYKIKISFNEWNPPNQSEDYTIDVYYGRLTAVDNKNVIVNDGKECYWWHGVVRALHFLDGQAPDYVAKNLLSHDLIKKFSRGVSSNTLSRKSLEWEIRKHAYIWEVYAPRLFELFDLRQTNLWEKYRGFIKEVYDIKGRNPNIVSPMDQIC
ncbi:MAG: hypothetical protein U0Z26_03890 [Anaerolineales bacterium]